MDEGLGPLLIGQDMLKAQQVSWISCATAVLTTQGALTWALLVSPNVLLQKEGRLHQL